MSPSPCDGDTWPEGDVLNSELKYIPTYVIFYKKELEFFQNYENIFKILWLKLMDISFPQLLSH